MFTLRPIRSFVFGAFYLISGIYSLGFSLFMEGAVKPLSGNPAIVVSPDALFPFEVMLFASFGAVFLAAAVFEFRRTIRVAMFS
jgi:hypothetical protein